MGYRFAFSCKTCFVYFFFPACLLFFSFLNGFIIPLEKPYFASRPGASASAIGVGMILYTLYLDPIQASNQGWPFQYRVFQRRCVTHEVYVGEDGYAKSALVSSPRLHGLFGANNGGKEKRHPTTTSKPDETKFLHPAYNTRLILPSTFKPLSWHGNVEMLVGGENLRNIDFAQRYVFLSLALLFFFLPI